METPHLIICKYWLKAERINIERVNVKQGWVAVGPSSRHVRDVTEFMASQQSDDVSVNYPFLF